MSNNAFQKKHQLDRLVAHRDKLLKEKATIDIEIAEVTSAGVAYIKVAVILGLFVLMPIGGFIGSIASPETNIATGIGTAIGFFAAIATGWLVSVPVDRKRFPLIAKQEKAEANVWDIDYKIESLKEILYAAEDQ